ncbi:pyrroline-5-carboxylate reductase [Ketobacter sp.]|uniref:pyrroline-5-carboxylate reductase n=1 Tax=Ketobacter sp. TaxID=2083498 RepID=UPI000F1D192A|nr:pyrroline-5-carboxylate reductase [Ketobacter sp.]RLT95121.1 MAG: pyrroline-5-carboxylate reductase [Ketobacter sp.]
MKITFIGAGNMASSLAGGMIAKGMDPINVTLSDINEQQLQHVRKQLQVNTTRDNINACQKADVVVLAVKPQVMGDVLAPLKDLFAQRKPLVMSIAAGITLAQLEGWLGADTPIVRCMPNTPALVETGASGLFANANVSPSQREQARSIMGSVGLALWVESEDQIDAVTAVSGSGPAYFFLVMEAMIAAGRALGLSEQAAKQLTLQTALGSAQMAITSDVEPDELRRRVTSPGGTTERAIGIMEDRQLRDIFAQALQGAYQRSKELSG